MGRTKFGKTLNTGFVVKRQVGHDNNDEFEDEQRELV